MLEQNRRKEDSLQWTLKTSWSRARGLVAKHFSLRSCICAAQICTEPLNTHLGVNTTRIWKDLHLVSEFSAIFTDGVWKSETTWYIEVVLVLEGTEEGMENMLQTSDSTRYQQQQDYINSNEDQPKVQWLWLFSLKRDYSLKLSLQKVFIGKRFRFPSTSKHTLPKFVEVVAVQTHSTIS